MAPRPSFLPRTPLVWVTLSPSQFAALMNVIWVSCVSILFVSYLLCVVAPHLWIDLYTLLFLPPHLQTSLWFVQLFSWLLLITAMCHDLNLLWSSLPLNVRFDFLAHCTYLCTLLCPYPPFSTVRSRQDADGAGSELQDFFDLWICWF